MTIFEGTFICAGCENEFVDTSDGQLTFDDGPDEKHFHSVGCLIEWNSRRRQKPKNRRDPSSTGRH